MQHLSEFKHLLDSCIAGDREAQKVLYDQLASRMFPVCIRYVGDRMLAEDVLQDTFLRIYHSAAGYRPQGKPLAWIFTIVRCIALDKRREQTRTLPVEEVAADAIDVADTDGRLLLHALLNRLSEEDRQILILHAVVGLKHREIAVVMEMPLGTVLSRYRRALNRLKTIAKEEELHDQ
mgnify:CR=1 FL=1